MDISRGPFRGSTAVAAGVVTKAELRGPRFQHLFPDVYQRAELPANLANRSRGAALLLTGPGAVSGYSAAQLLGAGCAPSGASAELTVPGRNLRERPGLTVHRDQLAADEVTSFDRVPMTTPLRTGWDLARWLPTVEAVVAVDALARVGGYAPSALLDLAPRYPHARWRGRIPGVIDLADARAESAMETRTRLVLVLRGLPRPQLQHEVRDRDGRVVARLDMAYPQLRLAVEYDGQGHRTRYQQAVDARRLRELDEHGWTVLCFTSTEVFTDPDGVADAVRRAIARRLRRQGA